MRPAVAFFAALLLTLTVLAGQSWGWTASQVRTSATAVADEAAVAPGLCHVFADMEPARAAGASEAWDTPSEVEDSVEAVAAGTLAVSPMAQSQAPAPLSARDAALPWLDGLLRPPRTLPG